MTRVLVAATVLAALAALAACAQPRQPTGGPPVERPPQVVAVSPEPFAVLTDLRRPVVIRFDERLSERLDGVADWRDAVIVSPETGDVRVRRGRRHIEVSVAGGWQPGLVYRVEVLPVVRDLFNNVRRESVELVFSTGPEIPETALAGFLEDRLTARPVAGARVEARHHDDERTYVALTDSAGFFALRHIPPGDYDLVGWLDQNRNRVVDFAEPQDRQTLHLAEADTVVLELELLPQDTTPARLLRAAVIDSTKVELGFDDHFEPGPVGGTARVYRAEDSTFVAEGELFHATKLDSLRQADREAERAAADAEEAAEAEVEGVEPQVPRERPARPDARPRREAPGAPARGPLPARDLILLLPAPLEPRTNYFIEVSGVTNIHRIPGGGGRANLRTPAPPDPPPDEEPPPDPPPDEEPPPR